MRRLLHPVHVLSWVLFFQIACHPPVEIRKTEMRMVRLSDSISTNDSLSQIMIAPYREKLEKDMNEVLGIADTVLEKGQPESLLGNFVADLVLFRGNLRLSASSGKTADICLLNNGGLRTSLPKGPLTRGKIYELMPFENELVALTISGESCQKLLEYLAESGGMPVSGLNMGIRNKMPVNVQIGGTGFDKLRNYVVLTSDYLASGGDKMSFFSNPVHSDTLHYKVRDAIIDHIRSLDMEGKRIGARKDGRIHAE